MAENQKNKGSRGSDMDTSRGNTSSGKTSTSGKETGGKETAGKETAGKGKSNSREEERGGRTNR